MVSNAMLHFLQYGEAVAENKLVGPTQLDNMVMKFKFVCCQLLLLYSLSLYEYMIARSFPRFAKIWPKLLKENL
jgi:hypothetical protein